MTSSPASWSMALGVLGGTVYGLEELAQAVRIILATPAGSRPHLPEFGLSFRWLDAPASVAVPQIVQEVASALARWEPRIVVQRVRVLPAGPGAYTVTVTWRAAAAQDAPVDTAVTLGGR